MGEGVAMGGEMRRATPNGRGASARGLPGANSGSVGPVECIAQRRIYLDVDGVDGLGEDEWAVAVENNERAEAGADAAEEVEADADEAARAAVLLLPVLLQLRGQRSR